MSDDEEQIKIVVLVEHRLEIKLYGSYIPTEHILNEFTYVDQLIRYVIGEEITYDSIQYMDKFYDTYYFMKAGSRLSDYIPHIIRDNTITIKVVVFAPNVCVCL